MHDDHQDENTCLLCGTQVGNWDLHRAVCRNPGKHEYKAQWGRCNGCGFAEFASCHVTHTNLGWPNAN